ncbi:MAG TPA: winged helix-turn-helix domain-containing protein [Candidatus Binatia bacterium]|jgi:TolB-like protein|nr:winged helix-turn-helix domain-containing protein [Candidatus Binatia bacterium]
MAADTSFSFGAFRVDTQNACIWRGTEMLKLTPKAFAVLHYLVTHPGRLVTKDELFTAVWQETVVSDVALSVCVRELRKGLEDDAKTPLYIETVHRRGYRFIAAMTQETQPVLPLPDKPSIVVLPFTNMSGDPGQDYFSDGITEDLTSDLCKISSLFVIARNSAFTYKGKAVKVQDVSREMGARYVLEGSVRKAGDWVRISAQLIDATTGYHLWSERYDRPLKDIFALQDEIVQKIVTTLKLQLTLQEQGHIVRKHTDNLEAYDSSMRGVEYLWRSTKEANAQARQMFEKALVLDPQYAEAYAWLGWTYYMEWNWRWSADPQTLERAWALAQQAVALADSLPFAHSLLSCVYAKKQQYDQAIAESERAIAFDPNNADS